MPSKTMLLTAAEVAEIAKVHTETIHRWTRDGLLPVVTLPNGRKRYRADEVEALLTHSERAS